MCLIRHFVDCPDDVTLLDDAFVLTQPSALATPAAPDWHSFECGMRPKLVGMQPKITGARNSICFLSLCLTSLPLILFPSKCVDSIQVAVEAYLAI